MASDFAKVVAGQVIRGAALAVSEDKKISLEEAEELVISKADIPLLERLLEGVSASYNMVAVVYQIGRWFGADLADRI
jgi:hypothetical protein